MSSASGWAPTSGGSSAPSGATDDITRAQLLDDGIEILTRLWSGDLISYDRERLGVDGVRFLPRPVQRPRVPLWSAALWPLRSGRARRAARCDRVFPFRPGGHLSPDDVHSLIRVIDRHRVDGGPYDVCVHGRRETWGDYQAAGVTWFLEPFEPDADIADVRRVVAGGPPRHRARLTS